MILKQQEKGAKVVNLIRAQYSRTDFFRWKSKYGDMEVSDARKMKQLEDENRRLK